MTDTDAAERKAPFPDKWPRASQTEIVERYHNAVRQLVAERFATSGKSWEELVHDPSVELTREDFQKIEDGLWMPARVEAEAEARVLLLKGVRARSTSIFSRYRRFEAASEEAIQPP